MKEPLDPPTIRYTVTETSLRLIFEQIIWNGVLKKIYLSTYIQDPRSKSIVYNDLNSFTHRFHQCVEFPDGSTNYPPANQRELPRSNRLPSIVEGRRRDKEGDPRGGVVGFPRLDGLIWKAGRVSRKGGEKWERQREIYIYIYTFCSRSCASRTSAVWPTARIFSSRVSIRANQTSTSFLFASYRWLSPSIASNSVFLCIIFEFISSQCSLSFVTETTIGPFSNVLLYNCYTSRMFANQKNDFFFFFFLLCPIARVGQRDDSTRRRKVLILEG